MEFLNTSSNEIKELFNKCIRPYKILSYSIDNLINKDKAENLICPICLQILSNPICCSYKMNSHSFCKECIDEFLKEKKYCPLCKSNFEYKVKYRLIKELNNLYFYCLFKKEGCHKILSYNEYINHINNCKYNNCKYECQVKKYNYKNKEFEKCGYLGNAKEIKLHFNLCALNKNFCSFCNKYIFQMDLSDHFENKCKFGIIKYQNGNKYFGQKQNKLKNGYGILYYSNGDKYEGQFKNDFREGFGILYGSNGNKYEGEFKNDLKDGYGILYLSDEKIYEGQWNKDNMEGKGILNMLNKGKYEGEFKNSIMEGYGIYYAYDGTKFEGQFEKGLPSKLRFLYSSDGNVYLGEFKNHLYTGFIKFKSDDNKFSFTGFYKNNMAEGYGIYSSSDGDKYEGQWKDNKMNGYGIFHLPNGERYEGKFENSKCNGYGIYYFSNGDVIEGEWKDNKLEGFVIYRSSTGFIYEGLWNCILKKGYGKVHLHLPNDINVEGLLKEFKI